MYVCMYLSRMQLLVGYFELSSLLYIYYILYIIFVITYMNIYVLILQYIWSCAMVLCNHIIVNHSGTNCMLAPRH